MDWQIGTLAKKSSHSGRDLKPGDTVVSIVRLGEAGVLERNDYLKEELAEGNYESRYLAKWERVVSENPEEDERQARKMALAGSEDFFISLYDDPNVDMENPDCMKQMLALMLERKRILKALGRPSGGVQKYRHPASGREFEVPQKELDEALIMGIQSQLDAFLL